MTFPRYISQNKLLYEIFRCDGAGHGFTAEFCDVLIGRSVWLSEPATQPDRRFAMATQAKRANVFEVAFAAAFDHR